jgi:hypothetical protein
MQSRNDRRDTTDIAQKAALAVGVVYTLVGLVGFAITGFSDFAGKTGETLMGFEINGLHNLVHLVIGLAGLALWRRVDTTRTFGWMLFVGYGATFFYGLAVAGKDASNGNFLSINGADNVLHLLSALAGLAIALTAGRRVADTMSTGTRSQTTAGR